MWDFEHGNPEPAAPAIASSARASSPFGTAASIATEETAADFDISYTIPARVRSPRAPPTSVSFPRPPTQPRPISSLFPTLRSPRAVPCARSFSSAKCALDRVRTVALDTSSLTSVALTKILFAKWLGGARAYSDMAPNLDAMLAACDAALLIGDPALQVDRERYITLDLAEEWHARTGKSFVFAFWAIRRAALAGHDRAAITRVFKDSRDHGLMREHLETVAQEWAPRLGLTLESVRTYFARNIHYYLDPPCLEGLSLFYRLGAEIGALPAARELEFL